MPTGTTIQLSIPPPCTIESFKKEIFKEEDVHPLRQQLTFNGRVLEDGHIIDNYNVQEGSTLDLVVRPGSKYMY